MTESVAVVGAGVAGLGVSYGLRSDTAEVTVFEATDQVGGRIVTDSRNGCLYDAGANYVKPTGGPTATVIADLDTAGLHDIGSPVYTVDAAGSIGAGDRPPETKWTYESGLIELPRRLADASGAEIKRGCAVDRLSRDGASWRLQTEHGSETETFDAVVLTPPAPIAAELLPDVEEGSRTREQLRSVSYRPVRSIILHYPFTVDRPYYGVLDTSGTYSFDWIGRERLKPGHVPEGEELLIVQMSSAWTENHRELELESAAAMVADVVADALDDDRLANPDWVADRQWEAALPTHPEGPTWPPGTGWKDLYVAGDWTAGRGRVGLALESGLAAADRLGDP